jgi:sugar lactone lactonase YvrE
METTQPYLNLSCSLGEGPHWDEANRCLRFVDIHKHEIHLVWPDQGPQSHRMLSKLDTPVAHTADIEGEPNHVVFGGKTGIGLLDRRSGSYRYLQKFWDGDNEKAKKEVMMRANDGGIDSRGRYYLGVMNDPQVRGKNREGTSRTILFRWV